MIATRHGDRFSNYFRFDLIVGARLFWGILMRFDGFRDEQIAFSATRYRPNHTAHANDATMKKFRPFFFYYFIFIYFKFYYDLFFYFRK